jgi:adenylate kinase
MENDPRRFRGGARVSRPEALLIIGPTGSGKTPLGDLLEQRGLRGRRCHHFDFGERLRGIGDENARCGSFTPEEVKFVKGVLGEGVLLENEHFHLAERTLQAFLEGRGAQQEDIVVLNGLPRHATQAEAVDRLLTVSRVVYLACTPDIACARIETNSGGDRTLRKDDCLERVAAKLEIFRRRTEALVAHYQACGARVQRIEVGLNTDPESILAELEGAETC